MKKIIFEVLRIGVKNEIVWKLLKPITLFGSFLSDARVLYLKSIERKNIGLKYFHSLEVQNGPFKGMKYPNFESAGSAIYPKLLGSYEKEINEYCENIIDGKYSEILDVGCAEGYYAVGLAIKNSKTRIFAYDTSEIARRLCREMAVLNNVSEQIIIGKEFTTDSLAEFKFTGKGLIICDCEGYEKELFTVQNIRNISNCDLIIETHDFKDINISTYLTKLFKETHEVKSIKSVDDVQKALTYDFPILNKQTLEEKKYILREGREGIMEWLICTAKNRYL